MHSSSWRSGGAAAFGVAALPVLAMLPSAALGQVRAPVDTQWADVLSRVRLGVVAISARSSASRGASLGSAFAISGGPDAYYLVTSAHVIPASEKARTIEAVNWPSFDVRRGPVTLNLKDVEREQLVDLAVLTPGPKSALAYATLPTRMVKPYGGMPVAIVGHPGGKPSQMFPTVVVGEGPEGTLQLDEIVEEGFSGAPVVDAEGHVVCVVRGGDPVAEVPREKKVMGRAFCTPIDRLLESWTFNPFGRGPSEAVATSSTVLNFSAKAIAAPLPVVRSIDITKDDHPVVFQAHSKDYVEQVAAPEGYRIVKAEFKPWSINKASFSVTRDDQQATLNFKLTSGPAVDRYRGWLKGKFEVTIVANDAPGSQEATTGRK